MIIVINLNGGEKTEPVGAGQISTGLLSLERRVGHARKIAKWNLGDFVPLGLRIFVGKEECGWQEESQSLRQ